MLRAQTDLVGAFRRAPTRAESRGVGVRAACGVPAILSGGPRGEGGRRSEKEGYFAWRGPHAGSDGCEEVT